MKTKNILLIALLLAFNASLFAANPARTAGPSDKAPPESEDKLIETLKTGATPDKAITCKKLAVWGSKKCVPELAPLLADKELNSWARIALENIPDPACDEALRDALGKVQGRQLVGVINSIAVRRDAKAVDGLIQKLSDPNEEIATCAAAALGKIGGDAAARALEQALIGGPATIRPGAAEGCILCAEQYLAGGKADVAIKLYDLVRGADVPRQRMLAATRGAILARGNAGIPLLVEQLRSSNKHLAFIGMRIARELPGPEVHAAVVGELAKADADRQALLIWTLTDRNEAASRPVLLKAAQTGPKPARLAAIEGLERLGDASCVPALLEAAGDADNDISQIARTTLARLQGKEVEAALLARFQTATGKALQGLIELAAQRKIEGSFPIIARCTQNPDPAVRAAAIETIGAMGDDKDVATLVGMVQKTQDAQERATLEKALMAITGRCGAPCVASVMPLVKSADAGLKAVGLHALAGCGGAEALAAVKAAIDEKDEATQDEAVRTLSTWPNRWPEDASVTAPLLGVANAPKKPAHKVLALRGYLQFLQGSKKLADNDKLAKVAEVMPLLTRPEERRLAVSTLGAINNPAAIAQLAKLAEEQGLTEEACLAIVNHKKLNGVAKAQRQKILQMVLEKSKIDVTRRKAQEAMK